jgi:hypothetical protein
MVPSVADAAAAAQLGQEPVDGVGGDGARAEVRAGDGAEHLRVDAVHVLLGVEERLLVRTVDVRRDELHPHP